MTWRCKHGDLAIIINETPQCRGNIGLIVQVRGPLEYLDMLDLYGWRIKPVHNKKLLVQMAKDADAEFQVIYWKYPMCVPDAWLLPISPTDGELDDLDTEKLLNPINLKHCNNKIYAL